MSTHENDESLVGHFIGIDEKESLSSFIHKKKMNPKAAKKAAKYATKHFNELLQSELYQRLGQETSCHLEAVPRLPHADLELGKVLGRG
eukprot:CAMPEP_0178891952 /NCGR_PEP_ID=MMETSP0747-20121128/19222_1 /TAXON_ID=913974 /ORGANISM="Nitzschia punctata, Strain CCMP561" /LENGTH=88 /DNA_ID=CAMNT_0020561849 /DNA_START=40 /DNA_END=302 /DNA_ORIENTATION=-